MRYLALVYYDEQKMQQLTQQEWDALNRDCIQCVEKLKHSGHFIDGSPLLGTDVATTLRVRDNTLSITDGPFAETKEQLAGYYLLEAKDLNDAIQAASHIPPTRYGSVEVRPLRDLLPDLNQR